MAGLFSVGIVPSGGGFSGEDEEQSDPFADLRVQEEERQEKKSKSLLGVGLTALHDLFGGMQQGALQLVQSGKDARKLGKGKGIAAAIAGPLPSFLTGKATGDEDLAAYGEQGTRAGLSIAGAAGGTFLAPGPGTVVGASAGDKLGDTIFGNQDLRATETLGLQGKGLPGILGPAGALLGDETREGLEKGVTEFGIEVATDPSVYLSGGTSLFGRSSTPLKAGLPLGPKATLLSAERAGEVAEGARAVAGQLGEVPGLNRLAGAATGAREGVGRAFSMDQRRIGDFMDAGIGGDRAAELNDFTKAVRAETSASAINTVEDATREFGALARTTGYTPDMGPELLSRLEEHQKVVNLAKTVQEQARDQGSTLMARPEVLRAVKESEATLGPLGLRIARSLGTGDDQVQLAGVLTKEGERLLLKDPRARKILGVGGRKDVKETIRSGEGFHLPDETVAGANETFDQAFGKPVGVWSDDPIKQAHASIRQGAGVQAGQTLDETIKAAKLRPSEDAAVRSATETTQYLPDPGGAIAKWRRFATALPSFGVRNYAGDVAKVMPEGVTPGDLVFARGVHRKIDKLPDALVAEKGLVGAARESLSREEFQHWMAIRQRGVQTTGLFHQDVTESGLPGQGSQNPLRKPGQWTRKAAEAGQDEVRSAMFRAQARKGANPRAAAGATRDALIDYSDITPLNRGLKGTVSPFATYYIKNTPWSLGQGMRKPILPAATVAAEEQTGDTLRLPQTPMEAAGEAIAPINALLGGDVETAGREVITKASGPFGGVPVAATESALNKSFFHTGPIETLDEPTKSIGVGPLRADLDASDVHILRSGIPAERALEADDANDVLSVLFGFSGKKNYDEDEDEAPAATGPFADLFEDPKKKAKKEKQADRRRREKAGELQDSRIPFLPTR